MRSYAFLVKPAQFPSTLPFVSQRVLGVDEVRAVCLFDVDLPASTDVLDKDPFGEFVTELPFVTILDTDANVFLEVLIWKVIPGLVPSLVLISSTPKVGILDT